MVCPGYFCMSQPIKQATPRLSTAYILQCLSTFVFSLLRGQNNGLNCIHIYCRLQFIRRSVLPVHPFPAVDGTGLDGLKHQLVDTGVVHPPQVCVKEPLRALKTAVVMSYLPVIKYFTINKLSDTHPK